MKLLENSKHTDYVITNTLTVRTYIRSFFSFVISLIFIFLFEIHTFLKDFEFLFIKRAIMIFIQ